MPLYSKSFSSNSAAVLTTCVTLNKCSMFLSYSFLMCKMRITPTFLTSFHQKNCFTSWTMRWKLSHAEWCVTSHSQVRPEIQIYSNQIHFFFPATVPHAFSMQRFISSVAGILRVKRKWAHRFGPHLNRWPNSDLPVWRRKIIVTLSLKQS